MTDNHPDLVIETRGLTKRYGTKTVLDALNLEVPAGRIHALLGEANLIGGEYRRDRLRWHVYAALAHERDADIAGYLAGDEPERRRYELAERTAAVFEQYLIYRPDWIALWERQKRGGDWQARVWRRVRAAIGAPHRARRAGAPQTMEGT